MDFIQIYGNDIKPGMTTAYQSWLIENERRIRDLTPPGAEYIGSYVAMSNSEKGMGSSFVLWRMESFGTHDEFAVATRGPLGEVMAEWDRFLDTGAGSGSSNIFLKSIKDLTIWGEDDSET